MDPNTRGLAVVWHIIDLFPRRKAGDSYRKANCISGAFRRLDP